MRSCSLINILFLRNKVALLNYQSYWINIVEIYYIRKLYYKYEQKGLYMKLAKITRISKNQALSIFIIATLVIIGGLIIVQKDSKTVAQNIQGKGRNGGQRINNDTKFTPTEPSANTVAPVNVTTSSRSLEYMIEEEKLAHDVYVAMYDKWGSRVFSNIQNSEQNHQNQLLSVMQSRNISDPRSASAGVFKDQSLQDLYNKLIAQGNNSTIDALKVGVAIEELDIADLNSSLSSLSSSDTDIKSVYESLLSGSKKHLSAFNRQLSR